MSLAFCIFLMCFELKVESKILFLKAVIIKFTFRLLPLCLKISNNEIDYTGRGSWGIVS